MITTTKQRIIPPTYDRSGNARWESRLTPPDDSIAVAYVVPDRIIPVIFVPGVMGSNLKSNSKSKDVTWRMDTEGSMVSWLVRGSDYRKKHLIPSQMTLDDQGIIPEGTPQHAEELRRRGWGEVGAMSYGPFLVWLENALNDYHNWHGGPRDSLLGQVLGAFKGEAVLSRDEIARSYKYRLPVHACGYNWLDDNARSAEHLKKRIDSVINRYRNERKKCEKVILVTHSMGGLVARHCSEVLGMSDKILGIVHGVMPTLGAPAVYRRFKAGTEGPYLTSKVLGEDAAEMTAVLSSAPGPLQLLPTPDYGNGWLSIRDGNTVHSFPQHGDPYGEIYTVRGKWWSMCEDRLINPLNVERDPARRKKQMDGDWEAFAKMIKKQVKLFHEQIKHRFHPNTHVFFGSDAAHKAYGSVTWHGFDDSVNDFLMRGDRPAEILDAERLYDDELHTYRHVSATLEGDGWKKAQRQRYTISEPDEPGDGTVPHRSGIAPKESECVRAMLQVGVGHEPAYQDSELARRFTVRAIVQIAQEITKTSLRYEE